MYTRGVRRCEYYIEDARDTGGALLVLLLDEGECFVVIAAALVLFEADL